MKVRAIDFIVNCCDEADRKKLERAIEFYRDTLGLPFSYCKPELNPQWAEFSTEPVTLALWDAGPPGTIVALAVEDIHAATEELRSKGLDVEEPHETRVCYTACFEDPFGNRLMLHQRKDGTWG